MVHERILDDYERFSLKQKSVIEENYKDLCELVAAICRGDSKVAGRLASLHVRKFNAYLKKEHKPAVNPVTD
jgi:hypothetical protein